MSSHDAERSSIQSNLPWLRENYDPFEVYEKIDRIGTGSLGDILRVRRKPQLIGKSAFKTRKPKGRGGFGKVMSLLSCKSKDAADVDLDVQQRRMLEGKEVQEYALKTIILERISQQFIAELRNEIDILRTLDHPNIIKIVDIFDKDDEIFVSMHLCSGGNLRSRLPYKESDALKIVKSLISAISYMHKQGIIHRDLKLENIMFENDRPDAQVKVIDFGLSAKFQPGQTFTEKWGTLYTMAPQVLQRVYTSQADMWSLGVITYMLLSGDPPFYGGRREMKSRIMRCRFSFFSPVWKSISTEAKLFISQLLELDPSKRLNANQANQSHWIIGDTQQGSMMSLGSLTSLPPVEDVLKKIPQEDCMLKKISLMVIAHRYDNDCLVKLRHAFQKFDKANDGVITYDELKAILEKDGHDEKDMRKLFEDMDQNHDGVVNYTEFIASFLETCDLIDEMQIADAFDRIDSDNTGFISASNIKSILGVNYSKSILDEIMSQVDIDSDGKICYDEFKNMFLREYKNEKAEHLSFLISHSMRSYEKSASVLDLYDIEEKSDTSSVTSLCVEDLAIELGIRTEDEYFVNENAYIPGGMHDFERSKSANLDLKP